MSIEATAPESPAPLRGYSAAAAQVCAVEHARHAADGDEDFSAVIRTMQQLAGLAAPTRRNP